MHGTRIVPARPSRPSRPIFSIPYIRIPLLPQDTSSGTDRFGTNYNPMWAIDGRTDAGNDGTGQVDNSQPTMEIE